MSQRVILKEDSFSLQFLTINNYTGEIGDPFVADILREDYVLQEKIIVPPHLAAKATSFSAGSVASLQSNTPIIFIGHPDLPAQYSSVIAQLEKGKSKAEKNNKAIKITSDGVNILYSAPIFSKQGGNSRSFIAAFNKISETLQGFPMQESAIARTWLFMNNILKDYKKLNTAREQFFAKWYSAANHFIPASTGIQGHMIGNEALAVEFCAFSGNNITIKQLSSPLQNEPTAYSKLFSRAVAVQFSNNILLFISGTAAIDKAGSSIHIGNFQRQMEFTLNVVKAILDTVNANYANIAQSVIYLKRHGDFSTCMRILDEHKFPVDRTIFQLDVDVCREDLLFEIELTAVIAK
jgi:enamine deaminase RidA (YjgF/YER057c/UK114 family)